MNNKGFISVTVIYSFFLVFLSLMVLIIANTATNRNSLNKMKDTIKEDIKEIDKKNTTNDNNIDEDDIESKIMLADYIKSLYTTQGANGLYHHDGTIKNDSGDVIDANDGSYRYTGADYKLTSKALNAGIIKLYPSNIYSKESIINFYCGGTKSYVGSKCKNMKKYYTLQYDTSNKQYSTYTESFEQAASDGYLTKDNVKNYVCFGTDANPCPSDNLYRIIGVFDEITHGKNDEQLVKLIKADYASLSLLGTDGDYYDDLLNYDYYYWNFYDIYYWNYKNNTSINNGYGSNTWSTSLLNKINLNKNYINNIGSTWSNKIVETSWKVEGNLWENIGNTNVITAYINEIRNTETTYDAKIGLMYVSDFAYAALPSVWSSQMRVYNNDYINSDWMYLGTIEWTITPISSNNKQVLVWYLSDVEYILAYHQAAVRPVFYLNPSVTYVSGSGTSTDPIRIN